MNPPYWRRAEFLQIRHERNKYYIKIIIIIIITKVNLRMLVFQFIMLSVCAMLRFSGFLC